MEVPEGGVTRKSTLEPLQCNERHFGDIKIHSLLQMHRQRQ